MTFYHALGARQCLRSLAEGKTQGHQLGCRIDGFRLRRDGLLQPIYRVLARATDEGDIGRRVAHAAPMSSEGTLDGTKNGTKFI